MVTKRKTQAGKKVKDLRAKGLTVKQAKGVRAGASNDGRKFKPLFSALIIDRD